MYFLEPKPIDELVQSDPKRCSPIMGEVTQTNKLFSFRHYAAAPQHFSKLDLNYTTAESSYQNVSKERPELALHINQNHQHQSEPQLQQLQIQVQLQHQQQQQTTATSPHQQHQGLLSPGLSFTGSG